jgi:hypothetical protein
MTVGIAITSNVLSAYLKHQITGASNNNKYTRLSIEKTLLRNKFGFTTKLVNISK